jgi:hypothetical protein
MVIPECAALSDNANNWTNTSLHVVRYVAVGRPPAVGPDFMVVV